MNYTELVTLAKAYTDRYDAEMTDIINHFFVMAESRINRLLKTRKQCRRAYILCVTEQEFYSLPPDWAGMRDLQLNDDVPTTTHTTRTFRFVDPKTLEKLREVPSSSYLYYSIIGNQIQIYPMIDAGYNIEMAYYQKVPALSEFSSTNWLADDHPDIYTAAVCGEISLFAKDYDVATGWFDRMKLAIDELENADWVERWSGDPLQVRIEP